MEFATQAAVGSPMLERKGPMSTCTARNVAGAWRKRGRRGKRERAERDHRGAAGQEADRHGGKPSLLAAA